MFENNSSWRKSCLQITPFQKWITYFRKRTLHAAVVFVVVPLLRLRSNRGHWRHIGEAVVPTPRWQVDVERRRIYDAIATD